jgi:hypothetical protein
VGCDCDCFVCGGEVALEIDGGGNGVIVGGDVGYVYDCM